MLGDPPLLLADEPTGALDSRSGATVLELLHELNEAGTTVVVITHDRDVAGSLPREVRLKDGRIEHDSAGRIEHDSTAARELAATASGAER